MLPFVLYLYAYNKRIKIVQLCTCTVEKKGMENAIASA